MLISEMDASHLENAIRLLERRGDRGSRLSSLYAEREKRRHGVQSAEMAMRQQIWAADMQKKMAEAQARAFTQVQGIYRGFDILEVQGR